MASMDANLLNSYFYFAKQEGDINLEAQEALLQCIAAYNEVRINYLHANFSSEYACFFYY
jgi:hypothetical protein